MLSFSLVFTGADALHGASLNGVAGKPCWAPGGAIGASQPPTATDGKQAAPLVMDAAHPSPHPGPQPPRVQDRPCRGQAVLGLLVGSVFLVHAGPDVVPHGHQWRQEVGLGRRDLLTTADLTRRRSNPGAETPSWFVFHRFAPPEPQSQARYEREVAVNVDQGRSVLSWLLQIDSASKSSLLSSAMSWPSRTCRCSTCTATIRSLARL